jgi:hypothetical protein
MSGNSARTSSGRRKLKKEIVMTNAKRAIALGLAGALVVASAAPSFARSGRNAAAGIGFAAGALVGAAASAAANSYYAPYGYYTPYRAYNYAPYATYGYGPYGGYAYGTDAYAYAPGISDPVFTYRNEFARCGFDAGYGRTDYSYC